MKIGLIGTGNMSSGLGKLWAAAGHEVFYGSRTPAEIGDLAAATGGKARVGTIPEAAAFGEAVVLGVPWEAVPETIQATGSALKGKVLIDVTNPMTPDYMALVVGHDSSGAEEIAGLSQARVVKAFNHIYAQILHSSPQFKDQNADVFLCGDDAEAKQVVSDLVRQAGFEPVDAGPLLNARYLEPLAELAVQLAYALGMGTDQAFKLIRR